MASTPGSRFGELIKAEKEVHSVIWDSADWRRYSIEQGKLSLSTGYDRDKDSNAED